jgi:UDP-N-acetylmuramate dehydrogenase
MRIQKNVAIASLTTMRLGGTARHAVSIDSVEDIAAAYDFADSRKLPVYVVGGGSNLIGRDEGFGGVVLCNKLRGIEVVSKGSAVAEDSRRTGGGEMLVRAASGEELDDLVAFAVECGYGGIEALGAIPGTVGGAVMQNAGAYGQELSDVLVSVEVYDVATQEFVEIARDRLELSYRRSIFNTSARGRYFVVAATIRTAVANIRAYKLPDPEVEASSGSFFKNITVREDEIASLEAKFPGIPIYQIGNTWEIASGWLVEQVGLKGKLLHGMRVSDKAALILINESAQSYADLAAARAEITAAVEDKFGFILQQEPEEI